MKNKKIRTISCVLLVTFASCVIAQLNSECVTPNKEKAKCVPITTCTVIFSAVSTRNETAQAFARDSHCGYDGDVPLVCCGSSAYPKPPPTVSEIFGLFPKKEKKPPATEKPTPTPKPQAEALEDFKTSALPDRTVCGMERDAGRIWGGEQTELDEFPWMVALEFKRKKNQEHVGVRCGGSLINTRYVLTAAHCLVHREFELVDVLLGEWDVTSDPDCEEGIAQSECADPVVKVNVEEIIAHPYYSVRTSNNDIGLVKLDRDITYTDYVRPICLPPKNLPVAPSSTLMTVAGWGVTENQTASNIKLKVSVPLLTNEMCRKKLQGKAIGVNQLCAGGELGKDSCQGDSGGPLMRLYENPVTQQSQWYQEGVVSKGVGCARAGYPAVYTRVDRYINWIIGTISEEDDEE